MKNQVVYLMLFIGASMCGCYGEYDIKKPDFDVTLTKSVYKIGEPVQFQMTGSADLVMFYSGEFGNDYRYHNQDRISPARMTLSFDTKSTTSGASLGFNPAYTPISYSTDFNGERIEQSGDYYYDMTEMDNAVWTDISSSFIFPPPDGKVEAPNGAYPVISSGSVEISDLFPSKEVPIYLRFHYKVNKYVAAAGNGRTTILINNFFIKAKTETEEKVIHTITQIPWAWVDHPSWAGATGTSRLPGTQANLQFQCQWNTGQDRERWAVAGPIYMADDVNTGVEPATCLKTVADPNMRSYDYTYSKPGTYTITIVAANASVYGREEVVKQFMVEIVEDGGEITPPEEDQWPN